MTKSKAVLAARIVLGLIYFVFGLNGFLQVLPMPPLPEPAMNFMMAMIGTGYLFTVVKSVEVLVGAMLLTGIQAPFALILITPITLNIVLFHAFLTPPETLAMPVVMVGLTAFLARSYWDRYRSIFN